MKTAVALFDFNYGDISHIKTLRNIKQNVDKLFMAFKIEPQNKMGEPPAIERFLYLDSLECIDGIIPYCTEPDLHSIFHHYDMQELHVSDIYSKTTFTGKDICEKNNIEIKYFSTSQVAFSYHKKDSTGWKS